MVVGVALVGCGSDGTDHGEVAAAFSSAFIDGDIDALAELSTDLDVLGVIPWRAEFLAALDLEADAVECVEEGTQITCTIIGHNARTRLLAPDLVVKRSLHLTIEDGLVSRGSFEFASPDMESVFEAFNQWASPTGATSSMVRVPTSTGRLTQPNALPPCSRSPSSTSWTPVSETR